MKRVGDSVQNTCQICALIWSIITLGTCTYVVFGLGYSGWWFLLAIFIASCWNCDFDSFPQK